MDWLDSDEGAWAVQQLKVAKQWGKPPLLILAGRPDRWREEDVLMATAMAEYELTRVDFEGRPKRLSESEDHSDAWDVDADAVNYPLRVVEEWRKNNPDPAPGVVPKIVYHPTIRPEDR